MRSLINYSAIMLLAGVTPVILGLVMSTYWRSRKVYRGFGYWVLANFSLGIGYLLLGLRDQVSPLLSVVIANALLVYTVVMIYAGTESFFDRPPFNALNHVVVGAFILLQSYFTYLHPSTNIRIVLASGTFAFLHLRVAIALLAHPPARLRATCHTIALMFILASIFSILRGIYAGVQTTPIDLVSDVTVLASAFTSICASTISAFYFLFLNSARVELDLEHVVAQLADSESLARSDLAKFALLEETSQLIASSLDEGEIREHAVKALVSRFGYAQSAICMLVEDDQLEISAISGTEDFGYQAGYRQNVGDGIVGHVAQARQVYASNDIAGDPYYFSSAQRNGSAAGVPLLSDGRLYGVLYVESAERDAFTQSDLQMLRTLAGHVVTAINKARLYAGAKDHLVVMTTLHRVSQIIASSLELDRIFPTVLQLLQDTFGYTHVSIYLLEGERLRLAAQVGYPEESIISEISVSEGIVGRTVQTRQLQFVRDVSQEPAFLRASGNVESEICVPLFKTGNILGVINVEAARGNSLRDQDADVLTALSGPIAIAIDNANLHAQAKALAGVDALTGLQNRRTFDETLASEIARATRYKSPLTLIIADIDEFKASNDQWGHPAGDAILRAIARMIRSSIRVNDSAARYGGDEFAVILPNTALSDGLQLAERLRRGAQSLYGDSADSGIPTGEYALSLGVASYPENGQTADELLLAADHAELNAKKLRKNRVSSAELHLS